jgi:hypothetical protein
MATNADNVAVAVTGAVYAGDTSTAAPTGTAGAVTDFDDLGYASEDGVVLTMPGAGDKTNLKAWQNGATVRVLRSATEDLPQIKFTLIETKLETIQFTFGVTVTQTATEGSFEIVSTSIPDPKSLVIDAIDGADLMRFYVPKGTVTAIGDVTLTNSAATAYELTIDCELDNTKGYNLKGWSTLLKSAA